MWTCNTTFVAETVLKNELLFPLFEKVVTQTDVALIKPEAEGFYTFYNADEPLSSYLMIGDSLADETAAKTAGIDFYKVDYFSR
ncbi:MAG: HAD hydrolase-like protein [Candidatus Roizmanbacteria bacterium]|nr:HAD hydrolase-like protein [Candidatus Roizmanbacteria bacterium]